MFALAETNTHYSFKNINKIKGNIKLNVTKQNL